MLTCDSIERINLRGAGYTLGDLRLALALVDMDAVVARGRAIVRLHLASPPETSLADLESVLLKALKRPSQNTLNACQQTFPISCIFLDAL